MEGTARGVVAVGCMTDRPEVIWKEVSSGNKYAWSCSACLSLTQIFSDVLFHQICRYQIKVGRVPSKPGGRVTLKAETNEMKINGDKWALEERQSEDCLGKSDQDRKEFRAM